jgi:hypothetical protein
MQKGELSGYQAQRLRSECEIAGGGLNDVRGAIADWRSTGLALNAMTLTWGGADRTALVWHDNPSSVGATISFGSLTGAAERVSMACVPAVSTRNSCPRAAEQVDSSHANSRLDKDCNSTSGQRFSAYVLIIKPMSEGLDK